MPRRTKYNPALQARICAAISIGATYEHAALAAGITYDTLNEWRKTKPQFSEALKQAEAGASVRWLARIEQAANDGVWQAAAWKLERRYPEQWGRRDRMEVKHEGTLDVRVLASLRAAIMGAVDDVATRTRIAEALMSLDEPDTGEGGENGRLS